MSSNEETPTTSAITPTAAVVSALPITVQAASHNSPAFVNLSVGELLQKQRRITVVTVVRKLPIQKFRFPMLGVLTFDSIRFEKSTKNLAGVKRCYIITSGTGKSIPNKANAAPVAYRQCYLTFIELSV
ncbi:hypothetical protein WUBG_12326, partial [Wuchereria bancrofti]